MVRNLRERPHTRLRHESGSREILGDTLSQVLLRGAPWVRKSHLAATALKDMPRKLSREQEALIADIYDGVRGGEYHSKYTERHRLKDLDRELGKTLTARHIASPIRIHDMAASNAITSLEMFKYLRSDRPISVKASDYYDRLHVVDLKNGWRVAFDVDCKPIQYIGPNLVVCARRPEPNAGVAAAIVKPSLQAALLPPALAVLERTPDSSDRQLRSRNGSYYQIALFHPHCIHLAEIDNRFSLGRDDVFAPSPEQYDAVRIANTLSTEFMPEAKLVDCVRAVFPTVVDGGLLVLGRNSNCGDGSAAGTIFARSSDRLIPVADVLGGYRHKNTVMQLVFA
jgi:hypothetical protein